MLDGASTAAHRTPLQREHVIPLALQGHFVLDHASCRRCAVITGRMEQEMLRGWFLAPRTTLQLKTRRPKERPTALPGIVRRAGVDEEAMVPIDAYPSALIFPLFAPPVAMVDRPAVALQVTSGLRIVFVGRVPRRMLPQELGGDQVRVEVDGDPYAFAQMIAKIAWGFAVAAWGLEALAGSPIPAAWGTRLCCHRRGQARAMMLPSACEALRLADTSSNSCGLS